MNASQIRQVPIDLIRPGAYQARRFFDPGALAQLAESIKESGVISPVVVRTLGKGFELLAGERRWRASQLAGLHEIPAVVRDDLDEAEAVILGLIENLQRESITPMETAAGLKMLSDQGKTHEEIGERIGKSRVYVTHHLRLLDLAPPVQTLVNEGQLSMGHAKVIAGLPLDQQLKWATVVVERGLTVRVLERRVAAGGRQARLPLKPKAADWAALERRLSDQMGYPVEVLADKAGKGELKLKFHSLDELDGLLARLGYDAG